MQNNSNKTLLVLNALAWAAALLAVSFVFKEKTWSDGIVIWMIGGYMIANGLLMTIGRQKR